MDTIKDLQLGDTVLVRATQAEEPRRARFEGFEDERVAVRIEVTDGEGAPTGQYADRCLVDASQVAAPDVEDPSSLAPGGGIQEPDGRPDVGNPLDDFPDFDAAARWLAHRVRLGVSERWNDLTGVAFERHAHLVASSPKIMPVPEVYDRARAGDREALAFVLRCAVVGSAGVLAQLETTGRALLGFETIDDAAAAVIAACRDPDALDVETAHAALLASGVLADGRSVAEVPASEGTANAADPDAAA